jgi:hypothetical protein
MAAASRRKGLVGEREVADVFERFAWDVRGLEGEGDWLCVSRHVRGLPLLHVEVKRAERLRLPEWLEQAKREAPAGALPLLVFRQSRQPWRVLLELEQLLGMLG